MVVYGQKEVIAMGDLMLYSGKRQMPASPTE